MEVFMIFLTLCGETTAIQVVDPSTGQVALYNNDASLMHRVTRDYPKEEYSPTFGILKIDDALNGICT